MTTILNAVASTGLTQTADGSGIIKLQSNGVTTNALAWVNFNATGGTITVRSSYNVSSVTRNSAGNFAVVFTTATTDANYSYTGSLSANYGTATANGISLNTNGASEVAPTTSGFSFTATTTGGAFDAKYINVVVHGN